jgi:potassium-transporting ATPase KdpC subunit
MRRLLLSALLLTLVMTVLTGLVYPLALTGVFQTAFHNQANGSLVRLHGQVVGSSLIGQNFTDAKGQPLARYFQPRPSAAGANGYDAMASGGSNLGPSNPKLVDEIKNLEASYRSFNKVAANVLVPSDAVTTSGSGLDPDISIANALLQAPRVAKARHLAHSTVKALINRATQNRILGIMGEPVVNVLQLNLLLDELPRS